MIVTLNPHPMHDAQRMPLTGVEATRVSCSVAQLEPALLLEKQFGEPFGTYRMPNVNEANVGVENPH